MPATTTHPGWTYREIFARDYFIRLANGKPAGSASPLIWAQAQYVRLVTDLGRGSLGDQPAIVADRYVRHAPPASLAVTATATAAGGQITVSGTAPAGSTVVISAGLSAGSSDTTLVVSTAVGPDGHFRATVPLRPGTNVITATAAGADATGWTQTTVKA